MEKSVKKRYIILTLIVAFIAGSIALGSPFNLIDFLVVRPIVNVLFVIFNLVHDFGLAIIIFTIIVKMLMLPLTKKSLKQTRLMKKIQPELNQIRKNCNGNKQLESIQTMDLYKRYNVKPFASLATLFIQLPIFIAIFSAIRVIATPLPTDNLMNRAYDIVAYEGSEIKNLEIKQQEYFDRLNKLTDEEKKNLTEEQKKELQYDFHPQLFGVINLEAKASDVINPATFSWSAVFMLVCSALAAFSQYFMTKQTLPNEKTKKNKKFRELLKDAKEGKEVDDSEITGFATGQMSMLMPLMMFFIMFNLHGALAFYYFLSNMITIIQQKIILKRINNDLDDATDASIMKEFKNLQEGKVVTNKKTGTKITKISARDTKKKRR